MQILSILFKSCKHGSGRQFINHVEELKAFLGISIDSSSPKVVGLALFTTGQFMCMIHAGYNLDDQKWTEVVKDIYDSVYSKLNDNSLDSEVKQICILTAADVVSVCHKLLGDEKSNIMINQIFGCLERNELQETALKALTLISLH